jgi:hypothetical protein
MRRLEASFSSVQQQALEKAYSKESGVSGRTRAIPMFGGQLRLASMQRSAAASATWVKRAVNWDMARADLQMRLLSVWGLSRRKRQETARVGLASARRGAAVIAAQVRKCHEGRYRLQQRGLSCIYAAPTARTEVPLRVMALEMREPNLYPPMACMTECHPQLLDGAHHRS